MWELGIYSAIAPFGLYLLASVWTYPAVLEELVKWGILRSSRSDVRFNEGYGLIVGLGFGLSEAVLFTFNAWTTGDWREIALRLLLTVPMHSLTGLTIAGGMKRKVGAVGLIIAMLMHAIFNSLI